VVYHLVYHAPEIGLEGWVQRSLHSLKFVDALKLQALSLEASSLETVADALVLLVAIPHAASGWRIHCGVEVTELSTNKQHTLSLLFCQPHPMITFIASVMRQAVHPPQATRSRWRARMINAVSYTCVFVCVFMYYSFVLRTK